MRVLYITYLGLLEPIPKSQVLPYLFELAKEAQICLLSYEKKAFFKENAAGLASLQDKLRKAGITWYRLNYHKYPLILSSFFDIFLGILFSLCIIMRQKVQVIHARANIPIAIGFALKLFLPVKLLYDRRGIMGEEHVEHSGWKSGGLLYYLAVRFEKAAMRSSDAIVVLTDRMHTKLGSELKPYENILIKTIPCCVEPRFFDCAPDDILKHKLGLSDKSLVLVYSGSAGTYNLVNEMFDFFKEVLRSAENARFLILTQNKETVNNLLTKRDDINKEGVIVSSVSYDKLPSWLSMADAGIIFRRPSPTAIAASPTKFSAYLACGLAIVATAQVGDLEEIINSRNIGVVLSGYARQYYREAAAKLLSLLKDKDGLRIRCRKAAEEIFPLQRGVKAYSEIYNKLA